MPSVLSGRRRRLGLSAWLAGLALLTGLAIPQQSSGSLGKQSYEGLVATQGVQEREPTIRLKVEFKKRNGKRLRATELIIVQHRAIAMFCTSGEKYHSGPYYGDEGGPGGFSFFERTGPINRKGRFELNEDTDGSNVADVQQLTGRVRPKGPATGTIRLLTTHPVFGTCDSGVVNWSAQPVAKLSPPKIPPCAVNATCQP